MSELNQESEKVSQVNLVKKYWWVALALIFLVIVALIVSGSRKNSRVMESEQEPPVGKLIIPAELDETEKELYTGEECYGLCEVGHENARVRIYSKCLAEGGDFESCPDPADQGNPAWEVLSDSFGECIAKCDNQ